MNQKESKEFGLGDKLIKIKDKKVYSTVYYIKTLLIG
jgi:hypothetical protein